jgi:hypothetical protein
VKPRARKPKGGPPRVDPGPAPQPDVIGRALHEAVDAEGLMKVVVARLDRDGVPELDRPGTPDEWARLIAIAFGRARITSVSVSRKRRSAQLTIRGNRGSETLHVPLRHLKGDAP